MATFTETLDATFTGIKVDSCKITALPKYTTELSFTEKWSTKITVIQKIKTFGD